LLKQLLLALLVAGMALVSSLPVHAQFVERFYYDHNGSRMIVERDRRRIVITYDKPRSALRKHGVTAGTELFRGHLDSGQYLEGDAHIFKLGCGKVPYYVYGQYHEGGTFKLSGAAPVLEGCRIVDNRYDTANANLTFTFSGRLQDRQQPQAGAGGNTGTNFQLYCLQNVKTGLNLRVGPSRDYGVIAEIPAGSCDVRAQNQHKGDWVGVEWHGQLGWVSGRFLRKARR